MMKRLAYQRNLSKKEEKSLKEAFSIKLGKHLKKIRKEKGFTQEDLAFEAGLHSTYIGHIETGTYTPSIFVIWKIAKALKFEPWELLKSF